MEVGLLVEDHLDAQRWLRAALDGAFPGIRITCVERCDDALRALDQLCDADTPPDVALVDLGLPDGSGVDLIRALRLRVPDCIPVVATRYEDDAHLFAALRAGAQGYLLKQRPRGELARLLKRIANGEPPLSPPIARRLLQRFETESISVGPPSDALTAREHEVLCLLAKGYTLARVGEALEITRHTVASHVRNIYEKLEVSSRAEATLEAVRLGVVGPGAA